MKKSPSGLIVIIVTIILVIGGLMYLSRNERSRSNSQAAGADDMASHHGIPPQQSGVNPSDLVGKPSPDFSLPDRDGNTYSLNNLKGKNVILFFNEGLMCYPSCWNQIVALARDERFKADDTVVLSVIIDAPQTWQRAIDKMPALGEATVVFDTDASVSSAFGMLTTASSMHYGQYPGHSYVLIDTSGIVQHVLDDPNMGIHNDALVAEVAKLR